MAKKSVGKQAASEASGTLKDRRSGERSKTSAGSALSQAEKQGVRVKTRDGVSILNPTQRATHFSNSELRSAVEDARRSRK